MSAPRNARYLDYNATSPIRPDARAAVLAALDTGGNASSVHALGRAARDSVEKARDIVAQRIGASSQRLIFTSGGTEANAIALGGLPAEADLLIVGATEHDAVLKTAQSLNMPVEIWPVDGCGQADLDWLEARLKDTSARVAVALMLANNETGVIQPVRAAADLVHAAGGRLHVDAVQAFGKIAVDVASLGADTLAVSAHKIGGPQGAGALAYGEGVKLSPLWRGGGQERGLRPGTENIAAIAGFAAAALACDPAELVTQSAWRDAAAAKMKAGGAIVVGEGAQRLPNTLCVAAPDWDSARQVMWLDLSSVCVSSGSACSSGKVAPSHVLTAMGLGALAPFSIRASGGYASLEGDWSTLAEIWLDGYARVMSRRRAEVA
jgi:cysteine desulfurase